MTNIAIVAITYNRLNSLKRLIGSLLAADYLDDKVDLIISMDHSGDKKQEEYINNIEWPHGNLIKKIHPKKLGLRKHVLFCGDLTDEYEHLCVFEDDIYVSPGFYIFAKEAVEYYKDCKDIAGISLYQYQWNQYVNQSFTPLADKYDVYFLQVASSWGQVWSREKWKSFTEWMINKEDYDLSQISGLPAIVSGWSENSWLKYHHAYLVDTNKFFVYPRVALSTNFSDPGQHAILDSTYQVDLLFDIKKSYRFCRLIDGICYDGFFENLKLEIVDYDDLTIDLYCNKKVYNKYLLSTAILPFKVERSYALRMRPHELNVINDISGKGIYMYNTEVISTKISKCDTFLNNSEKNLYSLKINTRKPLLGMWSNLLFKAIKRKMKK